MAQRVFSPFQDAKMNKDGCIEYNIESSSLKRDFVNEESLRKQWEELKTSATEPLEFEEDQAEEMRIAVMESIYEDAIPTDEWDSIIDRELNIFKDGEKYDYVSDLRRGYKKSL